MPTKFWETFVHQVATKPQHTVPAELQRLAGEIATLLASLDPHTAAVVFSGLTEEVAREYEHMQQNTPDNRECLRKTEAFDPSDAGAPPDAPKPVPVPPELVAEAIRNFNEAEIIEAIRDIQAGRGRKFEDVIDELEALPSDIDRS